MNALAVSADPAHWGRAFTADELGAGDAIKQVAAAADRALGMI